VASEMPVAEAEQGSRDRERGVGVCAMLLNYVYTGPGGGGARCAIERAAAGWLPAAASAPR
jgi:hypothetical protein